MAFSGYQIPPGILATMKEAAGNYMPEYGNWRFRGTLPDKKKPEDDDDDDDDLQSSNERTDLDNIPLKPPPEIEIEKLPLTDMDEIVEKKEEVVEEEDDEVVEKDEEQDKEPVEEQEISDEEEVIIDNGEIEPFDMDFGYMAFGRTDRLGTNKPYNVTYDTFNTVGIDAEADSGGQTQFEANNPQLSDAFISNQGGMQLLTVGQYRDADGTVYNADGSIVGQRRNMGSGFKKLATQPPFKKALSLEEANAALSNSVSAVDTNGIRTKSMAGHLQNIAEDIKTNIFKPETGDKNDRKQAGVAIQQVGNSAKELFGDEGLINMLHTLVSEGASSAMTKEETEIAAAALQFQGKPMLDENNRIVLPIDLSGGGTMPVDAKYIADLIKKRTIAKDVGVEFSEGLNNFFSSGQKGENYDSDAVKSNMMTVFNDNHDRFASILLDKNIFGTRPLIDKVFDSLAPGVLDKVNKQEFVMNALGDPALRQEIQENAANVLERECANKYNKGKGTQLSAEELINKYS